MLNPPYRMEEQETKTGSLSGSKIAVKTQGSRTS